MPTVRKLLDYAEDRVRHHRAYHSPLDILKAFYLRATICDDAGAKKPRLISGLHVHAKGVPNGIYLRTGDSDFMGFKEIFEHGEYKAILQWNLPASATVLDLGGNIGLASVYFSSVLPMSKLVVVEPDRENCRLIHTNCAKLIEAGRLTIVEAFIAASDGSAGIDRSSARSWAFKMTPGANGPADEQIRCISVPRLIHESGFERIDLLKCDVEGAEAELFANCREWIDRVSHLIVETHAPYSNSALFQHLNEAGWQFEILTEVKKPGVGLCFLKRITAAADPIPPETAK